MRYGCHCAHLLIKHLLDIHPLLALFQGVIVTLAPRVSLPGFTRVSLGIENSAEEIDTFIRVLGNMVRQPRAGVGNPFSSTRTDGQTQMDDFARAVAQRVYVLDDTGR